MATPTLTPSFTILSACDATTGWVGTNATDTEVYKQNGTAVSSTLRTTGLNQKYLTVSSTNLSNTHLRLWFMYASVGFLETKAAGGIRMMVYDGTNTGYWYLGGKDTYGGGWTLLTVDTARAFDSGSCNLNAVTRVGFALQLTGAPRNAVNTWFDYFVYGNGIKITGGTSGDKVTWNDIAAADLTAGYGAVNKVNSVYFINTNLIFGDSTTSSTTNCYFSDTNQLIVFEDQPVSATLYKIEATGTSTNTTSFELTDSVIKSASTSTRVQLDFTNANFDTLVFTGNSIVNADTTKFKAGQSISGCGWIGCNQVQISTASLTNSYINNSTVSTGALLLPAGNTHTITGTQFNNNSRAIEVSSAGTYSMNSLLFSGNTYDINNTSGGSVTINATNGANPSTYLGSVTINNTKYKKFTGIPTGAEVRVRQGAYTLGYQDNITSGEYQFNYTATNGVATVNVNLAGYVFEPITVTLNATDQDIQVVYSPDPSYEA
jgi:hypothetical protein